MRLSGPMVLLLVGSMASVAAQTPQPFPRPGQPAPRPATPEPPALPAPTPTEMAQSIEDAPPEAVLGVPIYPAATFLRSFDAGRGQRFYLFGVTGTYTEMIAYYRTVLKQRGSELFDIPPTYQFELARFREDSMGFPPSVTIKDYTWGGSPGYPNPTRGGSPERFTTVIQIVPLPPGAPR